MVLWELAACKLPFEEIRFNSQVEDAVMAGRRPELPATTCKPYALLIASCWHQELGQRPVIGDVVRQLELLCQSNMSRQDEHAITDYEEAAVTDVSPLLDHDASADGL